MSGSPLADWQTKFGYAYALRDRNGNLALGIFFETSVSELLAKVDRNLFEPVAFIEHRPSIRETNLTELAGSVKRLCARAIARFGSSKLAEPLPLLPGEPFRRFRKTPLPTAGFIYAVRHSKTLWRVTSGDDIDALVHDLEATKLQIVVINRIENGRPIRKLPWRC